MKQIKHIDIMIPFDGQLRIVRNKVNEIIDFCNSLSKEGKKGDCQWENCSGGEHCKKHSLTQPEINVEKLLDEYAEIKYLLSKAQYQETANFYKEELESITSTLTKALNRDK